MLVKPSETEYQFPLPWSYRRSTTFLIYKLFLLWNKRRTVLFFEGVGFTFAIFPIFPILVSFK